MILRVRRQKRVKRPNDGPIFRQGESRIVCIEKSNAVPPAGEGAIGDDAPVPTRAENGQDALRHPLNLSAVALPSAEIPVALEDLHERQKYDFDVEPGGLVIHVPGIEREFLFPGNRVRPLTCAQPEFRA